MGFGDRALAERTSALSPIPGVRVDGNDAVAVYEVALEAVKRAREGHGPTLIECMTYRWREHVGPNYDYDAGYRTKQELDEWMDKCPVKRISDIVSKEEEDLIIAELNKEIDDAVEFARQSPFPKAEMLTNEVF